MASNPSSSPSPKRKGVTYNMVEKEHRVDWEAFQAFFESELESGIADWQVDLQQVNFFDSLSLGNLIAVNGRLSQRGCRMTVLVKRGSLVERLLFTAKLDRLLSITQTS